MLNQQEATESAWMRPAAAAAALQVSRTTLIEMEKRGEITPRRLPSGHRRYARADVEALLSPESTPSSASASSAVPPADEGVSSFPTVPQQWTGEPQQGPDGPIRAALTDIATRFPLVPVELADAMDEHGGDAIAFAWISPTGVLLRLELVDGLARTG